MNLFKTKLCLGLVLGFLFFSPQVIAADADKTDGIAILWQMDIKEGKGQIFNDAIKSFNRLYAKKDGHMSWNWYTVATGPDTGRYIARSGNHNWADLDAAEKVWDDELNKFWTLNVAPLIENADRYITKSHAEIKHWTEGKNYKFFSLRNVDIKAGGDFYKHLKVIHETLQKNGFKEDYALSWNVSGGKGNTATLVFPAESWADMAEPSPTFDDIMKKTMSEDDLKALLAKYRDSYEAVGTVLIRTLPDLNVD